MNPEKERELEDAAQKMATAMAMPVSQARCAIAELARAAARYDAELHCLPLEEESYERPLKRERRRRRAAHYINPHRPYRRDQRRLAPRS